MSRFSPGFIFGGAPHQLIATLKGTSFINTSAVATHTFAALDFGTAGADRWIFVAWAAHNSVARSLNNMTIGGVSASGDAIIGSVAQVNGMVALQWANIAAGATGDVVFSWDSAFASSNANGVAISWYEVHGPFAGASFDGLDSNVTTTPVTKNLSVPAGGFGLYTSVHNNAPGVITGDFTQDVNTGSELVGRITNRGSVSNSDLVNAATKVFTATSFSSSAAPCPIQVRTFGPS